MAKNDPWAAIRKYGAEQGDWGATGSNDPWDAIRTYGAAAEEEEERLREEREALKRLKKEEEDKKKGDRKGQEDQNFLEKALAFVAQGTAKGLNTVGAEANALKEFGQLLPEAVMNGGMVDGGREAEAQRKIDEGFRNGGLLGVGTFFPEGNEDIDKLNDPTQFAKKTAGAALEVAGEVVPLGRGYNIAMNAGKAGLGKTLAKGAGEGAVWGGATGTGRELLEDDEYDLNQVLADVGIGAGLGAVGGAVGRAIGRKKPDPADNPNEFDSYQSKDVDEVTGLSKDPEEQMDMLLSRQAGQNAPITDTGRMLPGAGETFDPRVQRVKELEDEIDMLSRGETPEALAGPPPVRPEDIDLDSPDLPKVVTNNPNQQRINELLEDREDLRLQQSEHITRDTFKERSQAFKQAHDERLKAIESDKNMPDFEKSVAKADADDKLRSQMSSLRSVYAKDRQGLPEVEGRIAETERELKELIASGSNQGVLDPNASAATPDRSAYARQTLKEYRALRQELDGLESIDFPGDKRKLDTDNPEVNIAVTNELNAIETSLPSVQTGKVNTLVDYFRTPTRVLNSIGLKNEAKVVEESFENYRVDLNKNMNKIRDWHKRAPSKESSQRIFQSLDGQDVNLEPAEIELKNEIRDYLDEWADKLGIPKEKRVTDYITHIFDKDFSGDTVDPSLSQILSNKPTGKVYNPFTQQRLGKKEYVEDVWKALDAYTRRSTRQVNMDPALKILTDSSKNVDARTAKYMLSLNKKIALQPSKLDEWLNDAVGSMPGGDKLSPSAGTNGLRAWRNNVYRSTLGLNVGSATRNLTQGVNTFAELGTRDTLAGYSQIMRAMGDEGAAKLRRDSGSMIDELREVGILDDAFHRQDETVSAIKTGLQKMDTGLWYMFDTAEKINRGAAYFGAKNKFLRTNKGATEAQAREYANGMVNKTQFKFNDIETPLILNSQVAKTLTQFQSFNIKQTEYLASLFGNSIKSPQDFAKVIRWIGANFAVAAAAGNVMDIDWNDSIPFIGNGLDVRNVTSPTVKLGQELYGLAVGKNQYGAEADRGELLEQAGRATAGLVIPGGTQGIKTVEGLDAANQGYSETKKGGVRFEIDQERDRIPGVDLGNEAAVQAGLFGQYALPESQEFFDSGRKALSTSTEEGVTSQSDQFREADESMRPVIYDFYQKSQGVNTEKEAASKEITKLVQAGQINKAKRLAAEHNAKVEMRFEDFRSEYGDVAPDSLLDSLESYKIRLDNRSISSRKKRNDR